MTSRTHRGRSKLKLKQNIYGKSKPPAVMIVPQKLNALRLTLCWVFLFIGP